MTLTIAQAATNIATAARVAVRLGGLAPAAALDFAADDAIRDARDAHARRGTWEHKSTTEQIEDARFQGSVGRDILDGTHRPCVGNVREFALGLLANNTSSTEASR
jgi:hypothetical protein